MACRHIPTMTKSHHGGEMSIMIKVGMCQTSTSQSSFPSSTRCQVLCMRGQLRHALWAGKWRGRYLHPCNTEKAILPKSSTSSSSHISIASIHVFPVVVFHGSPSQELDEDGALIHDPVQECNDLINNRGCVKQYVNKGILPARQTQKQSQGCRQ